MKICTRCKCSKPITEFGRWARGKDGLNLWCRRCVRLHSELRRRARGVKPRAVVRTGTNKLCHKCRAWKPYGDFSKDVRTKDGYTAACKSCQKQYKAAYRRTEQAGAVRRARRKWRYDNDIDFRLTDCLRKRIRQALAKTKKSAVSFDLLGCTLDEFKRHIVSLWKPGMSWDNYGVRGWHIDHVIPCAAFDLTDPAQQRECFHYLNLQPLWAQDNWCKSDKVQSSLPVFTKLKPYGR